MRTVCDDLDLQWSGVKVASHIVLGMLRYEGVKHLGADQQQCFTCSAGTVVRLSDTPHALCPARPFCAVSSHAVCTLLSRSVSDALTACHRVPAGVQEGLQHAHSLTAHIGVWAGGAVDRQHLQQVQAAVTHSAPASYTAAAAAGHHCQLCVGPYGAVQAERNNPSSSAGLSSCWQLMLSGYFCMAGRLPQALHLSWW